MAGERELKARSLKDKNWYWVDKTIIRHFVPTIGMAGLVVYDFLASMANSDQVCYPSHQYVAKALGCSRSTVCRAIKRLEENGLIEILPKQHRQTHAYRLLRVSRCTGATGMRRGCNCHVAQVHTNDTNVTRLINDTAAVSANVAAEGNSPHMRVIPNTATELLALDLAEALDDIKSLSAYVAYARRYPEALLRRALDEAKAVPAEKIRRSRAALFNHLIKAYEKKRRYNNPGS